MNKKPSIPSIKKLYHEKKLDEDQQIALLSFACNMFCYEEDNRFSTIQKAIAKEFPELGRVSREVPRNLLREAAHQGLLTYRPPHANQMAMALADQFEFDRKAICVVHSRSINQVAEETADRLIKQIRAFKTYGNLDTVHIGFAGGRLLRLVAENLATRLREHSNENPHTIVFHAMVAAYGFDDFEADPNSFIT